MTPKTLRVTIEVPSDVAGVIREWHWQNQRVVDRDDAAAAATAADYLARQVEAFAGRRVREALIAKDTRRREEERAERRRREEEETRLLREEAERRHREEVQRLGEEAYEEKMRRVHERLGGGAKP